MGEIQKCEAGNYHGEVLNSDCPACKEIAGLIKVISDLHVRNNENISNLSAKSAQVDLMEKELNEWRRYSGLIMQKFDMNENDELVGGTPTTLGEFVKNALKSVEVKG